MIIGIIGSGGREHAICASIKKSKKIKKIYCFPGNAGTDEIAENVSIDLDNFEIIKNFIYENNIELIIIGPEKPLVDGLVDYLEKYKIKVFGPNKLASQLEGSKIFTKKLCEKFKIPTAKFGIFENIESSKKFLKEVTFPTVIKADNLASGKGVYICNSLNEAMLAVEEIFNGKFGPAKNLLIEEFLDGEEMSFFVVCDGKSFKTFDTAQDHKRVLEGDKGKNTGGMGAYSPSRLITKELENKVIDKIINPTLKGLDEMGTNYKGFLYAGLMIVKNEPYLIEYNVRMGDPETQVVIPKIKSDLLELLQATAQERLAEVDYTTHNEAFTTVVMVSGGYPGSYPKGHPISGLNEVNEALVFHAGTKLNDSQDIVTNGGRVLAITGKGCFYNEVDAEKGPKNE